MRLVLPSPCGSSLNRSASLTCPPRWAGGVCASGCSPAGLFRTGRSLAGCASGAHPTRLSGLICRSRKTHREPRRGDHREQRCRIWAEASYHWEPMRETIGETPLWSVWLYDFWIGGLLAKWTKGESPQWSPSQRRLDPQSSPEFVMQFRSRCVIVPFWPTRRPPKQYLAVPGSRPNLPRETARSSESRA